MTKLKLTAKTIKPYLKKIDKLEMITPKFWDKISISDKAKSWNGVGSELTAKKLRKALTWIYRFAICAVIIHDVIWQFKEKYNLTLKDFYDSNRCLKINARIQLASDYSKWYWLYGWCYIKAWLAEKACNKLGRIAWEN